MKQTGWYKTGHWAEAGVAGGSDLSSDAVRSHHSALLGSQGPSWVQSRQAQVPQKALEQLQMQVEVPAWPYLHFSRMNGLAISFCCGLGHGQVAVGWASAPLWALLLCPPEARPPDRLSAACGSCQAGLGDGTALKRGTEKEL